MKININDLYTYKLFIFRDTIADPEIPGKDFVWSNYRPTLVLVYKEKIYDNNGGEKDGMTTDSFLEEAQTISGFTILSEARKRAPVVAFIEKDKVCINVFPQYCPN